MRWIRLLKPLLTSKFRSRLTIAETSTLKFSVWLTDIDVTIMNHAAMMSVFETGRIDYMVRTGFFKLAKQQRWYVPVSSISVQFFRPLKIFQKAVVTTRVFHITEYFFFIEQKIMRQGKEIAVCIVKSKVKAGRENIAATEILKLLGATAILQSPSVVEAYEEHEIAIKKEFSN